MDRRSEFNAERDAEMCLRHVNLARVRSAKASALPTPISQIAIRHGLSPVERGSHALPIARATRK